MFIFVLMLQAIESWDFQGYGIMLGCLGLFGLFTTLERRIGQLKALIIHECLSMFPMTFTNSLLCGRWIGRYFFHICYSTLTFACSPSFLHNPTPIFTCFLFCSVFSLSCWFLGDSLSWDSTPSYRYYLVDSSWVISLI